jgi:hypothetical protein
MKKELKSKKPRQSILVNKTPIAVISQYNQAPLTQFKYLYFFESL